MKQTLASLIAKNGSDLAKALTTAKAEPETKMAIEDKISKAQTKMAAALELDAQGENAKAREARTAAIRDYIEAAKEARAEYAKTKRIEDLAKYASIKATVITINEEVIRADEKGGDVDYQRWAEISKYRSETATAYLQAKDKEGAAGQYTKAEQAAENASDILLGNIETLKRAVDQRKNELQRERGDIVTKLLNGTIVDDSPLVDAGRRLEEIDREVEELNSRNQRERIANLEKIAQMQKLRVAAYLEIVKNTTEKEMPLRGAAVASIRVADQYTEIVALRVKKGETIKTIDPLMQIGEAVAQAAQLQEEAGNEMLTLSYNARAATVFMRAAQAEFQIDWDSPSTSDKFRKAVEGATQIKKKILGINEDEVVERLVVATIIVNAALEFRHEDSLEALRLSEDKIKGITSKSTIVEGETAKARSKILRRKAEDQHNLGQYEEAEKTFKELMEVRCTLKEIDESQKERQANIEMAAEYRKAAGNWLNAALGEIGRNVEKTRKNITYANAHVGREETHLIRAIELSSTPEQKLEIVEELLAQANKVLIVVRRAELKDQEEAYTRKIARIRSLVEHLRK
jgi:hypothetical protein